MKRSIPLRGSVGAIDTAQFPGLTEGQLKAVAEIQAWELANDHERALLYIDSELEAEDRLEAARLLRSLSEKSRSTDLWYLFESVASNIEKGENLVKILRQLRQDYELIESAGLVQEKIQAKRGKK